MVRPLDDRILAVAGVEGSKLPQMFLSLEALVSRRVNSTARLFDAIMAAPSRDHLLGLAKQHFPHEYDLYLKSSIQNKSYGLELAKASTMDAWMNQLMQGFSITVPDVATAYPGQPTSDQELEGLLDRWSYEFGDLANHDPEHFFHGQPNLDSSVHPAHERALLPPYRRIA